MLYEKCVRAELGLRCLPGCAGWKRGKLEEDCALECVIWSERGPHSWEIMQEVKGETVQEIVERDVPVSRQVLFPEKVLEICHLTEF